MSINNIFFYICLKLIYVVNIKVTFGGSYWILNRRFTRYDYDFLLIFLSFLTIKDLNP